MPTLAVQLNHPGVQKEYPGDGYLLQPDGRIIRRWNSDISHYRKFILNEGEYLETVNDKPKRNELLFWGEWEGNSFFNPLNQINKYFPNGIHEPFHSIQIRGHQNTDPYIYGECFYYATCKQKGKRCNLDPGSVILFGSVVKNKGFLLDTVFVVGSKYELAKTVSANKAKNYSKVYREETLEQLYNEYLEPNPSITKRIYHSQTWYDNKEFFSFVPCKIRTEETMKGFERVLIPCNVLPAGISLTSNPQAIKFLSDDPLIIFDIWKAVVKLTISRGLYLGIRFTEPKVLNITI
jgi:hypothetical protein